MAIIEDFHIAQGDTLPYYPIQVRDANGPVTLSDVQLCVFRMAKLTTGSQGSIIIGSQIVSAYAFVTDALNGKAEYRWAVADTSAIGEYAVAFSFMTESGQEYTLPRNAIAKVIVEDEYATAPG